MYDASRKKTDDFIGKMGIEKTVEHCQLLNVLTESNYIKSFKIKLIFISSFTTKHLYLIFRAAKVILLGPESSNQVEIIESTVNGADVIINHRTNNFLKRNS